MDLTYLIGRVLFSLVFVMSGVGHFTNLEGMSQYAAANGAPAPKASVVVSGLMIVAGGLSVALGVGMEIGTWLLVFFLIPAAVLMHAYWKIDDPGERSGQQAHFMKNLALAGAALVLYWVVQTHGYGPFTLGEPMS